MSDFKILIKTPSRSENFSVNIKSSHTIAEAKNIIAQSCDTPAERQRLIFAGRVLKDHQIISDCKISDGVTVHMVPIPAGSNQPPTNSTPSQSSNQSSNTFNAPPPQPTGSAQPGAFNFQNLFGGGNGLGNMFGGGNGGNFMQQMQQNIMQNPDLMRNLMNSPMVQQLNQRIMDNPEMLQQMLENNPQMQQVMEQNPEIAHMMRDPAMLRQAMQLSQNPALMREMMRNSDRTMSHIENIPGGFNLLRQQYENIVEPMHNATQMPAPQDNTNTSSENISANPNNDPLPNPWAGNNQANTNANANAGNANTGNANANPMLNMFNLFGQPSAQNNQQNTQQQGNTTGGTQANPMQGLFGMDQNQLNQAMQMAAQLFNNQGGAQQGTNQPGANQPGSNQPGSNQQGANMFSMMSNLFGNAGGVGTQPNTNQSAPSTSVPSQQQLSPEARYAVQLQQLNDMGFNDQEANIRNLVATSGNVNAAIERILGGQ